MATAKLQPEMEAALIERVRKGEHEAFYELVRPHERGIYLAALSVLNNDADAEEAVQEAILKAFKGVARFRGEAKFGTWLVQITINEARMKVRKAAVIYMSRWKNHFAEKMKATTCRAISPIGGKFPPRLWRPRACARHCSGGSNLSLPSIDRCWYCEMLNI